MAMTLAETSPERASALRCLVCSLAFGSLFPATGVAAPQEVTVTCVSTDGGRRHCAGATDAGVALRQSVGSANCLLGRNWGYDATGVWVTEGCGAVFALGNPSHEAERLAAAAAVSASGIVAAGDQPAHADVEPPATRSLGDYLVYTRFGAQLAVTNEEAEMQDARSRIGFRYSTGPDSRFFAAAEWSVNLTKNPSSLNPGESTSGGFVVLDSTPGNVFGTRLGYVGIDFGEHGKLTLGKQWGVHYDVTSYTDIFNVFGAEASATFNAGTDGGLMGTGRADAAVSYRNTLFGRLQVGAQLQVRDVTSGHGIDGYGVSARLDILPGLEVGGTYTKALFESTIKNQLIGLGDDAQYGALGVRYATETLELAAVYARQKNGDLYRIPIGEDRVPVFFDATGLELAGRYQFGQLGLLGGYLEYNPDDASPFFDKRAQLQYGIVGLDYRWNPKALFFAEYRVADGIGPLGIAADDVFSLGVQYSFAKPGTFVLD